MRSLVYVLAFTIGGAIGLGPTELKPLQAQTIALGSGTAELKPLQAQTFALGSVKGIAYYTVEPEGLRVVTTLLASEATALRIVSVLGRDQNVVCRFPAWMVRVRRGSKSSGEATACTSTTRTWP